jgi:hypothetical protein
MMSQHLVRKAFRLRLAERSDLPSLLELDKKAWQQLAASEEELLVGWGNRAWEKWASFESYDLILWKVYMFE